METTISAASPQLARDILIFTVPAGKNTCDTVTINDFYVAIEQAICDATGVSPENIIISTGYNGMPKGCSDDEFPWGREGAETKYPYVVHAELNAILNAHGRDLQGSRLYVALFPCNECAKAIIQAGIKTVVYDSDKYAGTPMNIASKKMFDAAGVEYIQYARTGKKIEIDV